MWNTLKRSPFVWLAIGLVAGLMLGGLWPHTPLHAVTTDRHDTFAIATGYVDPEVEAVYFLDFLTGDLRAAVLGSQTGKFLSFYQYNIIKDLGVDASKNPHYLMATGVADLRRGAARVRPSLSVVYIAEVMTGRVAAYAIPWSRERHNSGQLTQGTLIPLDARQFRTAAIRPTAPE